MWTPERIADAAIALVDAEGVDGLTVRGLAQALGGEASLEMKRQRQAGPNISQKQ